MPLDDSSLETEPKFEHGVGNSEIRQLNSEFKSIHGGESRDTTTKNNGGHLKKFPRFR